MMIFDRVRVGTGEGAGGRNSRWGGSLGPDQVGRGQLGAIQGQQEPDGGRGTGDKMVVWGKDGGVGALAMGYQTRDGVPDWGWGSSQ